MLHSVVGTPISQIVPVSRAYPPNGHTIPWEEGVEHFSKKKSAQNTALLPHAPWQARGDPNKYGSENHSLIPRGFSIQASLGGGGVVRYTQQPKIIP